jgi:uncharacterized HAD superfamily protein
MHQLKLAPKHQVKHFSDFRLKFDGTVLSDVSCVKNLGMYFDKTISLEQEASAITRSLATVMNGQPV